MRNLVDGSYVWQFYNDNWKCIIWREMTKHVVTRKEGENGRFDCNYLVRATDGAMELSIITVQFYFPSLDHPRYQADLYFFFNTWLSLNYSDP